tara:strand:- start:702 stop:2006 length:1305 start_codon:yes stop_codon:yes gene_type:complete
LSKLSQILVVYKPTLLWLLLVILGGMVGGFPLAAVLSVSLLFLGHDLFKVEALFALFIVVYFLGDNFSGVFSFAQNLRFVILGIGLLVLLRFDLVKYNLAIYILPFSILATIITYSLSPLGMEASARGVSYFLVALIIFKCVQLLVEYDAQRFYNLIVVLLTLYFLLNVFLFFVPFIEVTNIKGRYAGLMANPNGLGMAAMFSYAIIDVIWRKKQSTFDKRFFKVFKIILIVLIILSGSRTSIFGVIAYEMSIRLLKNKILLIVALLFMVYVYSISATFSPSAIISSLGLSDFLRTDSLDDASGRTEVWVVAIAEIKNQIWLGKGMLYDNYFINFYGDRFLGEVRARHWYGIWNSYLSLLLNVGIIGLAAFSFFWYKMYALSQMKIVRFAFLMMCLFSAISESWMAASMNAFMPLVFLCWGLQIYQSKPNTEVL